MAEKSLSAFQAHTAGFSIPTTSLKPCGRRLRVLVPQILSDSRPTGSKVFARSGQQIGLLIPFVPHPQSHPVLLAGTGKILRKKGKLLDSTATALKNVKDMKTRHFAAIIFSTLFNTLVLSFAASAANVSQVIEKATSGNADAQFDLGVMYAHGDGVEKNLPEAIKWYRKAAEQGDAYAQCNLGILYYRGLGVAKDPVEAVRLLNMAAEKGIAAAQLNLGIAHRDGFEGVKKDMRLATEYWAKSAAQGNAAAQYNLALAYYRGDGVTINLLNAAKYFRFSAEQGYAPAQFNLALMYHKGEGVSKDTSETINWFRKAAEQGHENSKACLREMGVE